MSNEAYLQKALCAGLLNGLLNGRKSIFNRMGLTLANTWTNTYVRTPYVFILTSHPPVLIPSDTAALGIHVPSSLSHLLRLTLGKACGEKAGGKVGSQVGDFK